MASVSKDKNGRIRLQFTDSNNKRQTIRLGKMSKRNAEAIKTKVELLLVSLMSKQPLDIETVKWVSTLDDILSTKLAKVGLIRHRESALLGDFLDAYIKQQNSKPSTLVFYGHTQRNLIEFFGKSKLLREINKGHAEEWRLNLVKQGLSESTIQRRCGVAKQFFRFAVNKELIPFNPFSELKSGSQVNQSRIYFITREHAAKVIDACPDAQWRLLFALSRFGGLRNPSETLSLRWEDINWDTLRMNVRSPKTEHHPGGESRMVPIFPELRPFLEECWEIAEPGTEFVITRYRSKKQNLRTHLMRIVKRAGLEPWAKLWHNLRATRQTELMEAFPSHVVCKWIGNSIKIAEKHYLQVTDEHFKKATQNPTQSMLGSACQLVSPKKQTPQIPVFGITGHGLALQKVGDTCHLEFSEIGVSYDGLFSLQNLRPKHDQHRLHLYSLQPAPNR